jgi:hypothetical protein
METEPRIASTAGTVDRLAGKGAVEIDDVQPGEALGLEGARLCGRIVVENSGLRHLAAFRRTQRPSFRSMAG